MGLSENIIVLPTADKQPCPVTSFPTSSTCLCGRHESEHQRAGDEKAKDHDEALGYLSRLFQHLAPQCTILHDLPGVCTQIDNLIAGQLKTIEQLKRTFNLSPDATVEDLQAEAKLRFHQAALYTREHPK